MNASIATNGAPDSAARHQGSADAPRWSAATLFGFRFFLTYVLLGWGPMAVFVMTGAGWWGGFNDALGRWSIAHVLRLPQHSAPFAGPADNLAQLLGAITLAALCAVAALVWTVVDRRRDSEPRAWVWLHTGVRFTLAAFMLWYGWDKVLPGQFGPGVDPIYLTQQVGQLTPSNLLWTFMGASRGYTIFAGVVETAGGILLLTRRTATLGALVSAAAMSNVLMLNLAYDVNVKLLSAQVLAMAVFVLAPDMKRLADALILNRPTTPRHVRPLLTDPKWDRVARIAGVVIATGLAYWTFQEAAKIAHVFVEARNTPLYGTWEVQETPQTAAGAQASTDPAGWRYLVFPRKDTDLALLVFASKPVERYTPKIDAVARTIQIRARPNAGSTPPPSLSFDYSRPDHDHLVLRRRISGSEVVETRLRRVDPASFPLVNHRHQWRW